MTATISHTEGKKFLTLYIKTKCPSWNTLYSCKHWAVRKRMADEFHDLVYATIKSIKNPPKFTACTIVYTINRKGKDKFDLDNACIKLFTDGLVLAGVIPGDDMGVIKFIGIKGDTGQPEDMVKIEVEEV